MHMCRRVGTTLEYIERSMFAAIEPRDRQLRSHWLLPSDRYVYEHAQATTINTPSFKQTSFSNEVNKKEQ